MKRCKKCLKELPPETFPTGHTARGVYRRGTCRACMNAYYRRVYRVFRKGNVQKVVDTGRPPG